MNQFFYLGPLKSFCGYARIIKAFTVVQKIK